LRLLGTGEDRQHQENSKCEDTPNHEIPCAVCIPSCCSAQGTSAPSSIPSERSHSPRERQGESKDLLFSSTRTLRYVATAGSPIQEIAVGSEAKDLLWGMRITPIGHVFSGF